MDLKRTTRTRTKTREEAKDEDVGNHEGLVLALAARGTPDWWLLLSMLTLDIFAWLVDNSMTDVLREQECPQRAD